jgi:hypothetical protein
MAAKRAQRHGMASGSEGASLAHDGGAGSWPKIPANPDPVLLANRDRRGRRRPAALKRVALIVIGIFLFLAISGLLARFFATENVERDDDLALIQAQAKGNVNRMLADLTGCSERPSCVATVRADASRLRRTGAIKILSLKSSTAYSLTGSTGKTRLAWTVIGMEPVVQCVEVRRTGSFFNGISVALLSLSAPIPNEADC